MALCESCGKDMADTDTVSCDKGQLEIGPELYDPIPLPITQAGRCPDCGIAPGGVHHTNCQHEVCPKCHGQLISCSCGEGV